MTQVKRNKLCRERKLKKGLVRMELYTKPEYKQVLRDYNKELLDEKK